MQFRLFAVAATALLSATAEAAKKYTFAPTNVWPRYQWAGNGGYCGEISTIQAGLKYGQYLSQYDLRAIAFPNATRPQSRNEYLVGENDAAVAEALDLAYTQYDSKGKTSKDYLAWIKSQVRKDTAVTITVYMNQRAFYGDRDVDAGESEYDHIVTVTSVESDYNDDLYHADDILTFEDHGLYNDASDDDEGWAPYDPDKAPQYYWSQTFGDALRTRQEANALSAPPYSVPGAVPNYGVGHTGLATTGWEAVAITTTYSYENPPILDGTETRPEAMAMTLEVTASGLKDGQKYTLFKFDDLADVPTSGDLATQAMKNAVLIYKIPKIDSDGTYVYVDKIKSSDKAIYRCLKTG